MTLPSRCSECDTADDPCQQHPAARRYLEAMVYEPVDGGGWRAPELERERWKTPPAERPRPASAGTARPIQALVVELEAWVFLSDALEATVRAAYAINPKRTTRLVEKTVVGAREQKLDRPDAYLMKHAGAIASPPR